MGHDWLLLWGMLNCKNIHAFSTKHCELLLQVPSYTSVLRSGVKLSPKWFSPWCTLPIFPLFLSLFLIEKWINPNWWASLESVYPNLASIYLTIRYYLRVWKFWKICECASAFLPCAFLCLFAVTEVFRLPYDSCSDIIRTGNVIHCIATVPEPEILQYFCSFISMYL